MMMKGEIYLTKNKHLMHIFCLAFLVLCLFISPLKASETEAVKTNAQKEDSALSHLSDAIKKQKEKLTPKPPEPYEVTFTEYGPAIEKALAKAGIKKTYVETVKYKYPDSALNQLKNMTDEQKLDMAAGILYIKKCSYGRVSQADILRESAAIVYYASRYKIPTAEAFAMADLESHCTPHCVGRKGPVGPYQVHWPSHSKKLIRKKIVDNRNDMFDADKGVHAGLYVFANYINYSGSIQKSLRHYLGRSSKRYTKMFYKRVNNFKNVRSKLKKSL